MARTCAVPTDTHTPGTFPARAGSDQRPHSAGWRPQVRVNPLACPVRTTRHARQQPHRSNALVILADDPTTPVNIPPAGDRQDHLAAALVGRGTDQRGPSGAVPASVSRGIRQDRTVALGRLAHSQGVPVRMSARGRSEVIGRPYGPADASPVPPLPAGHQPITISLRMEQVA